MNSAKSLLLPAAIGVLIFLFGYAPAVYGQNWVEDKIVNTEPVYEWPLSVLHPASSFIVEPDPSIGTVRKEKVGNELVVFFEPAPGAVGTAEFVLEHFNATLPLQQQTTAFRLHVDNSFVDAVDDYATVTMNSPEEIIAPLANDLFEGGSALSLREIAVQPEGTASVSQDGQSISFTPSSDFTGMTYLTYIACDDKGVCEDAQVNICVLPDGPLPQLDTLRLSTDNKSSVTAFLPLADLEMETEPANGRASSLSAEAWEYVPDTDFEGTDMFELSNGSAHRVIIVEVIHKDPRPIYAVNDKYYTRTNEKLIFDVRDNDLRKLPIHTYTNPRHGELSFDNNAFAFTPDPDYSGVVRFNYTVTPLNSIEEASVEIVVGNLPPDNRKTYQLYTRKDQPLVINYDVPIDGYDLQLTNALPEKGELILYDGTRTIDDIGCESVSGYDVVVYTPEAGFSGNEQFEVEYQLDAGETYRVKIDVEVSDQEAEPCACIDKCVWPGDANADGVVDMVDVLTLGWNIGEFGPARDEPDNTNWVGQDATDWRYDDEGSGMNLKYVDGNGDGIISADDLGVIADNYLKQHALVPRFPGQKADFEFVIIPPDGPVNAGDEAVFQIAVGSEQRPVLDMHGVRFSLNLPERLIEPGSVRLDFHEDSWLGHGSPNLEMQVTEDDGRIDAAFTRTDGVAASGHGIIITMVFIVVDDIEGFAPEGSVIPFDVELIDAGGTNSAGRHLDIDDSKATLHVVNKPAKSRRLSGEAAGITTFTDDRVSIYPNPVSGGTVEVRLNGDRRMTSLELYDVTGKLHTQRRLDARHHHLDIGGVAPGMYFLRIVATDGVVTKKVEIVGSD